MLLFIIALLSCVGAELVLDLDYTKDTLYLEAQSVYLGEFPHCIDSDIAGERRLLKFGSRILNDGNETAFREAAPSLHYNAASLSGSISLPCLRDSECRNADMQYYRCTPPAVSPGCASIAPAYTKCHWIDITTLAQSHFTVNLTLEGQNYSFEVDLDKVDGPPSKTLQVTKGVVLLLLSNLTIIFLPFAVYREPNDKSTERKIKSV